MTAGTAQWFVYQDNERLGPFTTEELTQKITQAQVTADAFIFAEGFHDWVPAPQVAHFTKLFDGTSPQPKESRPTEATAAPSPETESAEFPQWSVHKQGQTLGPYTNEEIQQKLQDQSIDPTDFIWTEGWADWVRLQDTTEWRGVVEQMGRLPPPATEPIAVVSNHKTSYVDEEEPPLRKVSGMMKGLLILVFVCLIGYAGWMYRDAIMRVAGPMIPQNLKGKLSKSPVAAPSSSGTTPAQQAPQGSQPGKSPMAQGPQLASFMNGLPETGIGSQPLFADYPAVPLKVKQGVTYTVVIYSTSNPVFISQTFTSASAVQLSPVFPQAGAHDAVLLEHAPNGGVAIVAKQSLTVASNQHPVTLSPIPERAELLREKKKKLDEIQRKILSHSSRPLLWAKVQNGLAMDLVNYREHVETCLVQAHFPTACAELGLLYKDQCDLYRAVSLSVLKTPPKRIAAAVGRIPAQILKSYKTVAKQLDGFIDAPKAVESVDQGEIETWLKSLENARLTAPSSAQVQ
jgi:hypothetical protein